MSDPEAMDVDSEPQTAANAVVVETTTTDPVTPPLPGPTGDVTMESGDTAPVSDATPHEKVQGVTSPVAELPTTKAPEVPFVLEVAISTDAPDAAPNVLQQASSFVDASGDSSGSNPQTIVPAVISEAAQSSANTDGEGMSIDPEPSASAVLGESTSQPNPSAAEVSVIDVTMQTSVQESTNIAVGTTTPALPLSEIAGLSNGHAHPDTSALFESAPVARGSSPSTLAGPTSPLRMYRTGYIYDMLMMMHCQDGYTPTADNVVSAGDYHPEDPMRIKRIFTKLAEAGMIKRMKKLQFEEVKPEQVLLVHTEDHMVKVEGTASLSDEMIHDSKQYYDQLSLYVNRETATCARLSCGGVIQACTSVCLGEVRNAFAIVRPPGHHAEPDEPMGFCFYNNVAVAAKEMIKQNMAKKVLILDWDVHHGNGTQRAFWNDPNVLYISLHRHDGGRFYPTSDFGALDMVGEGPGEGRSVNIPWPSAGFGDGDYIYAFQKIVMPIAYEFDPDLVIISAGFDAAEGDMLGECHVSPAGYGHMTHMLCALAKGKVVVALEGGYNLDAISRSALAVAQVLLGETPAELNTLEASEVATEVIHEVAKVQGKYWKSIDVKACEPPEVTDIDGESPVYSIPDLLKIHRAHHMFTKHELFQIPLANPDLEAAFAGQVICNEGVYETGERGVLVVFVHDFGNLRVETDGVSTTNVSLANSYLLDTSDAVVRWVKDSGFNIVDVNILQSIPTRYNTPGPRMIVNRGPEKEGQLLRYLWDNYIELSEAENVVLIGHGTGCGAIMELINHREVQFKVKAVVQVAGIHTLVKIDPHNETRRNWFRQSNRIYVPSSHPVLDDEKVQRRLGGQIFTSERAKVVDVLNDVLPQIQSFVASKVGPIPESIPTSNGHSSLEPGAAAVLV
ncbi:hypothetical protein BCR39DRAFT_551487 [Naematelia encephala]|uniref:histone deacetylase n=1 Tax=Naematelia encephala TaxID=71784 RepID=A0A1Y2AIU7_9TREE|nr:hypothetical protein BCR39DRAFT_551487 [Naematelia encephala]